MTIKTSHKANRLNKETSPYLLQHAFNPVDWYPWSEEALERARREDLPILLSIGYSACHWCHVMESESFEDDEIAAIMNQNYVCIKVRFTSWLINFSTSGVVAGHLRRF